MDKIEEAVAEVRRVAESHCPRCGDGPVAQMAARAGTPHTCHEDMAAAHAAMLAVLDKLVAKVNARAEANMLRTGRLEGAHKAALDVEVVALLARLDALLAPAEA